MWNSFYYELVNSYLAHWIQQPIPGTMYKSRIFKNFLSVLISLVKNVVIGQKYPENSELVVGSNEQAIILLYCIYFKLYSKLNRMKIIWISWCSLFISYSPDDLMNFCSFYLKKIVLSNDLKKFVKTLFILSN